MSVRTNPECIYPTTEFAADAALTVRQFASVASGDLRGMDSRLRTARDKALRLVATPDELANADETAGGGAFMEAPGTIGDWCVGMEKTVALTVPNENDLLVAMRIIWFCVGPDKWAGVAGAVSQWRYQ